MGCNRRCIFQWRRNIVRAVAVPGVASAGSSAKEVGHVQGLTVTDDRFPTAIDAVLHTPDKPSPSHL